MTLQNEYGHVETSAKDGDGVSAAITAITALVIEQLRESGLLASRIAAEKEKRNNRRSVMYMHVFMFLFRNNLAVFPSGTASMDTVEIRLM